MSILSHLLVMPALIFFTCQAALPPGGPKIVFDHVCVCMLWVSSLLAVYDAIDNAFLLRAHEN